MKITIQDKHMIHVCDYSVYDRIDGEMLDEYSPSVKEVVDDTLELLSCLFSREKIADYLKTHIPAMDYSKDPE